MTAAIHVERLTKTIPVGFLGRPRTLLSDLSFVVRQGSAVAFVGPNGAGKSTTMRHLIGGSRPTSGTVRVFDEDPARPSARRNFGYLPDSPALPPHLSARETLEVHARLAGAETDLGLLERVGLSTTSKAVTRTFSKGMQTRLGIALALIGGPPLLLLDEPMSGLDPVGRREVRDLIRDVHQAGKTILFSTHVLADVETLCDDVIVINGGHLVFSGTILEAMGESRARLIFVAGAADESVLKSFGTVSRHGDQWALAVDVDDPFAIVAALQAKGVRVNEVRRESPRLEDRVLHLLNQGTAA